MNWSGKYGSTKCYRVASLVPWPSHS